jgi:hypothetical protein
MDYKKYLFHFSKDFDWKKVSNINYLGDFKSDPEIILSIKGRKISLNDLNLYIAKNKFDVRTDDLIKVFRVNIGDISYYFFILEHRELFNGDYLINSYPQ